jgi:DNA repair protein RadC
MIIELKEKQKVSVRGSGLVHKLIWNVIKAMQPFDQGKEHLFAIGVNRAFKIIYLDWISMGSVSGTIAEPREVFRTAVLQGASAIIIAHNHPSGNLNPSNEDKKVTKTMVEAGKILHIQVVDHVIVSSNGYYSFAEEGELSG